jgi:hypothetical protein
MFRQLAFCIVVSSAAYGQHAQLNQATIDAVQTSYGALSQTERANTCPSGPSAPSAAQVTYCLAMRNLLDPRRAGNEGSIAQFILQQKATDMATADVSGLSSFLSQVAANRLDVQNSASSNASGSSSVAERAGISDVLGIALDAGAVTQSVNGSALTLNGNALSLYRFVTNPTESVFAFCATLASCETPGEKFLNNLSGSATLNLSKTTTSTATGTAAGSGSATTTPVSATALIQNSASHLTGFSVRYQIYNQLDLRSQAYKAAWAQAFSDPGLIAGAVALNDKAKALAWLSNPGAVDPAAYDAAKSQLEAQMASGDRLTNPQAVVDQYWTKVISDATAKNLIDVTALKDFLTAGNNFMALRQNALNKARQQAASGLTLEYDYSRQSNQPRLSTARLIYTLHPGILTADTAQPKTPAATKGTPAKTPANQPLTPSKGNVGDTAISFNVGADFYNSPPAGLGALRDLQAALQFDHHFGTTVATLAGYYQYQNQASALMINSGDLAPNTNIVLPASGTTLLAPKGNIVVAQAMVTFALKSGTKMPVGVTWSNRTELIKANELRGHIGFNFDWSSILAGAKSQQ